MSFTNSEKRVKLDICGQRSGNASLMTPGLRQTLCDHSAGNDRVLTTMVADRSRTDRNLETFIGGSSGVVCFGRRLTLPLAAAQPPSTSCVSHQETP